EATPIQWIARVRLAQPALTLRPPRYYASAVPSFRLRETRPAVPFAEGLGTRRRQISLCGVVARLIQRVQDFGKLLRPVLSDNVVIHPAQLPADRDHDIATELHPGTHFFYSRRETAQPLICGQRSSSIIQE